MKVEILSFSPTGNTRKVCESIKKSIENRCEVTFCDITLPDRRYEYQSSLHHGEYLIVATPIYCESVAQTFLRFLKATHLKFNKAIILCTYGGISCGTAIWDVKRVFDEKKIPCIGAAEVPARHEFALAGLNELTDNNTYDYEKEIVEFITKCLEKKEPATIRLKRKLSVSKALSQETLTRIAASIKTDKTLCNHCSACLKVCPIGLKVMSDDNKACIGCAACVMVCKTGAKKVVFRSFIPRMYLKYNLKKTIKKEPTPKFT